MSAPSPPLAGSPTRQTRARGERLAPLAVALAGPLAIVAGVLAVLHGFAFGNDISLQHPDILGYWYPTYCFLGRSLAAGHVPLWNPTVMGGVPFAADPQSGWMYLPPMLLFTVLSCGSAIRWIIVLQPLLGGLGLYAFLRTEGLSRAAATLGGLVLALGVASSDLTLFYPFPASFAWTAVTLAVCSRFVRARTWGGRLAWALATALAWGQLVAAHFAHGALIGTTALVAYVLAKAISRVRAREWTAGGAVAASVTLALTLPLVNAAFLLPRLAYLPATSFTSAQASLVDTALPQPLGWPLKLARFPGAYLGAIPLVLALMAWRSRRFRSLAVAFTAWGALSFAASLGVVSHRLAPMARRLPGLSFYAHYPGRFGLALFLAIPVLAAIGVEVWLASSTRARITMLVPGALIWGLGGLATAGRPAQMALFAGGLVVGITALFAAVRRIQSGRPGAAAVAVVVFAELVVNGLLGQVPAVYAVSGEPANVSGGWFVPLRAPAVDTTAYLRGGPIAHALRRDPAGRYLTLAPQLVTERGYLSHEAERFWPLLANQRAMLFDVRDAQGYNPVQLLRYWRFVREVSPRRLDYNAAVFPRPQPVALDLLQVRWVVGAAAAPPLRGLARVASQGEWSLYRFERSPPRVSVVSSWRIVPQPAGDLGDRHAIPASLRAVLAPGFDPERTAVLETAPRFTPATNGAPPVGAPGSVSIEEIGRQSLRVSVATPRRAVVLVRTPFASGWRATVDGRQAPVVPTDFLVQGVAVGRGRHVVSFVYEDPWIWRGLVASALVILAIAGFAVVTRRRVLGGGAVRTTTPAVPNPTDRRTVP